MSARKTYLGEIQDVTGTNASVNLTPSSLSGFIYINGQGYRAGQIGSFVRIPIGFSNLYGIVSQVGASAAPNNATIDDVLTNNRWMTIQLVGEGSRTGAFTRGLSQYPTVGDEVHLVSEEELKDIYGQPDLPYFVKIGHVANAESIPALVDVNKLVTRHSAVLGTTGSGKSTTVASLIRALSDSARYPSSRILILDVHGEYGPALKSRATIYKIGLEEVEKDNEKPLVIPYWALNFDELCEICFGEFATEKDRNLVMERVQKYKSESLAKYPKAGVAIDSLSVDSPIPFSIHHLWHELYVEAFGTYYSKKPGRPRDNLAYEVDGAGNPMMGDPLLGIAPSFKHVKNEKDDDEKINYLPSTNTASVGKQLLLLGSKLRIPRYNFIFKPGPWSVDAEGRTDKDLDSLLEDWLNAAGLISILDLSGVPTDVLHTTLGAMLRTTYDALFWSRNLSQGGKHRPMLIVMEEAHIYLNPTAKNAATKIAERIVKEGRKYGIGAMIVSQRPSEINPTILSQCGTLFALRLSNSTDRTHVTGTMSDGLEGLTNLLPILRTGEAIITGEAVKIPMRAFITPPPKNERPDSLDPIVYDEAPSDSSLHPGGWGIPMEANPKYSEVVETWRAQNPKIAKIKKEKTK